MVYATGAHPDYDPRMAESIRVDRYPERTAWGITWTDTGGVRHGRVFEYLDTAALDKLRGEDPDKIYPLALASTQAGCVWVWMAPDGTETATLQLSGGELPLTIREGDWTDRDQPHVKGIVWEAVGDGMQPTVYDGSSS